MADIEPKMKLIVELRDVYGTERIYPLCDTAKAFAQLTGRKTLERRDIEIITGLGYRVIVQPRNLSFIAGSRELGA